METGFKNRSAAIFDRMKVRGLVLFTILGNLFFIMKNWPVKEYRFPGLSVSSPIIRD